ALKNKLLAVGREIAFPAAPALQNQLPRVADEAGFWSGIIRRENWKVEREEKKKRKKFSHIHVMERRPVRSDADREM
ncbi:MAG TPA: hypothetical protein VK474_08890, partial [Chthoniobacterales bacterium]|nr:hypothetical protein [Chthoniobacterales bacterium]